MKYCFWLLLSAVILFAQASLPIGIAQSRTETNSSPDDTRGLSGEGQQPIAPDRDAEIYRLKRLPEGAVDLPSERYLAAQAQMKRMPRSATFNQVSLASETNYAANTNWRSLGPDNMGGRTLSLVVHPEDPAVVYAGSIAGGVWKSINSGESWEPLTEMLANVPINSLVFDPIDSDTLYAGTGLFFADSKITGAGIFKTTDGGAHWTQLASTATPDFYYVNKMIVSRNDHRRVYAATSTGVWRSVDGGANWTIVLTPPGELICSDLVMRTDQSTDYLFASCGRGPGGGTVIGAQIYRNQDAGGVGAWSVVYSEGALPMGRTTLALAPSNQNIIYAASASIYDQAVYGVYRSIASGDPNSWTAQVKREGNTNWLNLLLFSSQFYAAYRDCGLGPSNAMLSKGVYNNVMAVDPVDPNRVWIGGIDLFRSDDGGLNWGLASYGWVEKNLPQYVPADQHVIVFHPQFNGSSNQTVYVAGGGGIFRADKSRAATAVGTNATCQVTSAVAWTSLNRKYGATQFTHGVPFPDGTSYLGAADNVGVLLGSDASGSDGWRVVFKGGGGQVAVDASNPNLLYYVMRNGTGILCWKSTDRGATFSLAGQGLNATSNAYPAIIPFTIDPSDSNRLWLGGFSFWRTTNGASLWQSASDIFSSAHSSAIAVAPTDANTVLVGTVKGAIYRQDAALNADSGTRWPSTQPRAGYISSITFDPTDRNIAYATYSTFGGTHVWRSIDAGMTWTGIDGTGETGLPDLPVHSLVVDPNNTARLFIGTDAGIFTSSDFGASWSVEQTDFPHVITESLGVNTVDGVSTLFAFTRGRGAWQAVLSTGSNCRYSLSETGKAFDAQGGQSSITITKEPSSCNWTAGGNVDWIVIDKAGDRVNYTVAPNPNSMARVGTLTIAGRSFTVTQAAMPDVTPPKIVITFPTSSGELYTSQSLLMSIGGTASDNVRIYDQLILSSDRNPNTRGTASVDGAGNWSMNGPLRLESGVNLIKLTARDVAGNVGSTTLKVIYTPEYYIETVAGGGTNDPGDGGAAITAKLITPQSIAVDKAGNLYIGDGAESGQFSNRVRKVSPDGTITTLLGGLLRARLGGTDAAGNVYVGQHSLNLMTKISPSGATSNVAFGAIYFTVDQAGNIFISHENRIKRVDAVSGAITTIAGNGSYTLKDNVVATESGMLPLAMGVDGAGNLYFHDAANRLIRKIDTSGIITTYAGNGTSLPTGDGSPALTAGVGQLGGLTVASDGTVYFTDVYNGLVRRITPDGIINTIAGNVENRDGSCGFYNTLETNIAATTACLYRPSDVTVDSAGRVYLTEGERVRRLTKIGDDTMPPALTITTPIASTGEYTTTTPNGVLDLTGIAADNIGVAQVRWNNERGGSGAAQGRTDWKITGLPLYSGFNRLTITVWDLSGNTSTSTLAVTYNPTHIISLAAGNQSSGYPGYGGDGGSAIAAQLGGPRNVAIDGHGNIYFADLANHRVRRVTPAGVITTYAGNGQIGSSGDGGPAITASFNQPFGLAFNGAGNLYIADTGNHRIRKVTPAGIITTIAGTGVPGFSGDGGAATAARLNGPLGLVSTAAGDVYIADSNNYRIRKVTGSTGIITTVAGNGFGMWGNGIPALEARFYTPMGLALDSAENLYLADYGNHVVWKVARDGVIRIIAGTGTAGYNGDGGQANAARLRSPTSVVLDAEGNIYIADAGNYRIRRITPDGIITTFAGNGNAAAIIDGASATVATLGTITGLAFDRQGNLFVADLNLNRLLVINAYHSVATVSAASYSNQSLAPESIAVVFGANLANIAQSASTIPLPTTLAGATIKVRDSASIERLAALLYADHGQINFQIPVGTATGPATIIVNNSAGEIITGSALIAPTAPGIFVANADGKGVAAALLLRMKSDGTQRSEPIAQYDASANRYIGLPLNLDEPSEEVFLILFGTGIRGNGSLASVTCQIDGMNAEVLYAGAQGNFVGLDQVNIRLPRPLRSGDLEIILTVDGKPANRVTLKVK
jgi:uncharacterized protein (TIGR03437 family)